MSGDPTRLQAPHLTSPPTTTTTFTERTLRIGTRSSTLALAQVDLFTHLLSQCLPPHNAIKSSTHPLSTSLGDTNKTTSLHTLASTGKSLWTEDLETELLGHRVDVLIHSLKDVPTKLPHGCKVRAVGKREAPADCVLLSPPMREKGIRSLGALPRGSMVGTSSVRRTAMLRRAYPHLSIKDCRGNVPTRIRKLETPEEGFDALILAAAGVQRLGLRARIDEELGWETGMAHAVGQGALGVEWRADDEPVEGLLAGLERETGRRGRWEGEAERALLRVLEGGCSVPVGVECSWSQQGEVEGGGKEGGAEVLVLKGMVVSVDGERCVEGERRQLVGSDEDAEECGIACAKALVDKGAGEILKEIDLNRGMLRGQDNA